MDKRKFLKTTLLGAATLAGFSSSARSLVTTSSRPIVTSFQQEKPPALAPDLVRDFVRAGHSDLQKTKEMLEATPGLLNASWDWGGGDFESALEGAGHRGERQIAEFLLSKGARINVFAAAMLGRLDIVKPTLTAFPELKTLKGPHGLMLIHHATKGGEQAKEVLEYLNSIGAS